MKRILATLTALSLATCTFDPVLDNPGLYEACLPAGGCLLDGCVCFEGRYCVPENPNLGPDACVPGCRSDTGCDDEDPCTVDRCPQGKWTCEHVPDPACACTDPEECIDGNDCTDDRCVEGRCENPHGPEATSCDDGLWCTVEDACVAGACQGTPRDCGDANPCSEDECDEDADECRHIVHDRSEELCWDGIDQDCDGVADGCCLGDGGFGVPLGLSTLALPRQLAAGDFNRDGILDVVATSGVHGSGAITVHLGDGEDGRGDGRFQDSTLVLLGTTPASVAVRDLNGDDILDLAVADQAEDEVHVLFGMGDGSFTTAVDYPTCGTPFPVIAEDFDLDGVPEIVTGCHTPGEPQALVLDGELNEGTVTWIMGEELHVPPAGEAPGGPLAMIADDLNYDGVPDLIMTVQGSSYVHAVPACRGTGSACATRFEAVRSLNVGGQPLFMATGDFLADGAVDLAVSVHVELDASKLVVVMNDGLGGLLQAQELTPGLDPGFPAALDIDNDQILDLVLSRLPGDSFWILPGGGAHGRGDGTFTTGELIATEGSIRWFLPADVNADGITDLVTIQELSDSTQTPGKLTVLPGTGMGGRPDGTFRRVEPPELVGDEPFSLAAADYNADGITDLAVAVRAEHKVKILTGEGQNGKGIAEFSIGDEHLVAAGPIRVVTADFNRDRIPDLAVLSRQSPSVSVLTGMGNNGIASGGFEEPLVHTLAGMVPGAPIDMALGDFDGDDIPDLVVIDQNEDKVAILAEFQGPSPVDPFRMDVHYPAGAGAVAVAVADFDENGADDLAVGGVSVDTVAHVYLLLGHEHNQPGSIAFSSPVPYATTGAIEALATGDFDADGIVDLAAVDLLGGSVRVLLGQGQSGCGDGTFSWGEESAVGGVPTTVLTADLDADGILDLVVGGSSMGQVSVLIGEGADGAGNGTFLPGVGHFCGPGAIGLAAGRFSADGFIDLAVANFNGSTVTVLVGQGVCAAP